VRDIYEVNYERANILSKIKKLIAQFSLHFFTRFLEKEELNFYHKKNTDF
jgi:hypothetical protein